jgi:hypothetical protein
MSEIFNHKVDQFTAGVTPTTIILGYNPKWVRVINRTTLVTYEKYANQAAANCYQIAADGTRTLNPASLITFDSTTRSFTVSNTAVASTVIADYEAIR